MTTDVGELDTKKQLMAAIAPEVARIEQCMRQDLMETTDGADPLLCKVLDYGLFNGGKRLRPLLFILAARLCGMDCTGDKQGNIYKLAIAFEFLHGATLYHDDVIDGADMRRGKPSVNSKYGMIAAILGGDYLHSRSMYLVGSLGGGAALDIFCKATNGMVDGEFLQLRNANTYSLSESDYFEAVQGKTSLLIGATCEIGAMAAGATPHQQNVLADYGISLGTAFQIIDDLLDYQGDCAATGKAVGNDFYEGKMTLPVILALKVASPEDSKRLLYLLENKTARKGGLSEAQSLIEKYNGFTGSCARAEAIVTEAMTGLEVFGDKESRDVLSIFRLLAQYVLTRNK
jgi:octaprenyl-diphosphate synthase